MKKNIYLIILAVVAAVCIIIGLAVHTGLFRSGLVFRVGDKDWSIGADGETIAQTLYSEKTKKEDLKSVVISSQIMDIKIVTGRELNVEYTGDERFIPEVTFKNNELKIIQKTKNLINISFGGVDCSLTITLPAGTELIKLDIENDTGTIEIKDLRTDEADLQTDTGKITVSQTSAGRAVIKADTGAISMSNTSAGALDFKTDTGGVDIKESAFGGLKGRTDTGSVRISDSAFGDADIRTDTGSVVISGLDETENYSLDLSSDTGRITVNGEKMKQSYRYDRDDSKLIKIETDTGSISIE